MSNMRLHQISLDDTTNSIVHKNQELLNLIANLKNELSPLEIEIIIMMYLIPITKASGKKIRWKSNPKEEKLINGEREETTEHQLMITDIFLVIKMIFPETQSKKKANPMIVN